MLRSLLRKPNLKTVLFLTLFATVVGGWFATLAPRQLGGAATYIVVDGTSMQPKYHTGDLVVLRRQPSYHVGEIVAVDVDGGHVIHRLYAGNPTAGWQTKGINKNTPDLWVIPESHILGAAWFEVPKGGVYLHWVGTPLGRAALAAGLVVVALLIPSRKRRRRATPPRPPSRLLDGLLLSTTAGMVALGLTLMGVVELGIGARMRLPLLPSPVSVRLLGVVALAILAPTLPLLGATLLGRRSGTHPGPAQINVTEVALADVDLTDGAASGLQPPISAIR